MRVNYSEKIFELNKGSKDYEVVQKEIPESDVAVKPNFSAEVVSTDEKNPWHYLFNVKNSIFETTFLNENVSPGSLEKVLGSMEKIAREIGAGMIISKNDAEQFKRIYLENNYKLFSSSGKRYNAIKQIDFD